MATHDYVIANQSGAAFRTDLNNALAAIVSNNSNSSEPTTKYAYQWWADTSNNVLKIRNSANDGWIELLQLDGTLTLEDGSASTPALAFRDDLNTGIFSSAADTFNVATGGVERMELGTTTIFNEDGADVDFRIEGDTEANLFYVDAGNDNVLIGQSSGDTNYKLHIKSSTFGLLKLETTLTGADAAYLEFYHNTSSPADNDQIGIIQFKGKNSNNDDHTYAYMMVRSTDVTDGSEDADVQIVTQGGGANATRFTISSVGDITANTGNFVIGTAGKGIDFSAQTASSATTGNEVLDHYEEGTFTPTNTVGLTLTNNNPAYYVRIGAMVHIQMDVSFTGAADVSQCGYIQSLPFTSENVTSQFAQGSIQHISENGNFNYDETQNDLLLFIAPNESRIDLVNMPGGTVATRASMVNRRFRISMWYKAA